MSDVPQELRRISWGECFGFTHLFRAFRLAIHPTKLLLAFCGVLLTYGTGRAMDAASPASSRPAVSAVGDAVVSELDVFVRDEGGRKATLDWLESLGQSDQRQRAGVFKLLLDHARASIHLTTGAVCSGDLGGLVGTVRRALMGLVWLFAMHWLYGVIFCLISLAIWSFFGGALCRVAALHAAREERIGLGEALGFAKSKFLSFFAAPLMPLAILALFAVLLFLGGLVGAIPAVGEVLVGLLFFLALLGGFVMAFVVVGALAGFSLTFPTVAVEGSDAFDALSRSFSYIYQRPWRTAFYALLSLAYGAICLAVVKFIARIMLCAVHLFVGLSMNLGSPYVAETSGAAAQEVGKLDAMWQAPSLTGESPFWGGFGEADLAHVSAFARFLLCLWIFTVVGAVGAYVVSFYFSASTLIYFLLRREVDATDLEDVYVEEAPETEQALAPESSPAPEGAESEEDAPPATEPTP